MSKHFTVLGIHDGHNASAAILKDGKILAAVSEERLSRIKNDFGYPKKAVEKVMEISDVEAADIDKIALGSVFMHSREFFQDWNWYTKGYSQQIEDINNEAHRRDYFLKERLPSRKNAISQHLGISPDKIDIVGHHDAHAATAYFSNPRINDGKKTLVLTLDGSGDGLCATVSIGENGKLKRVSETRSQASLGKVYSRVTFLLGMKPWEHEYKIMGLAPYADQDGVAKSYGVIRPLIELDEENATFRKGTHIWPGYCYSYLKSELENHRFDWIAGAVQKVLEELITKWVESAIRKTGISRVVCAGGVFMNVKANMLLTEIEELDDIFIFPSCGDESISIGAAYKVYADYLDLKKIKFEICPFDSVYLGPEFMHSAGRLPSEAEKYHVQFIEDINGALADFLAEGEIVARFSGRMEWGARALGNRSILVDPRNIAKVKELNAAIKHRDFWMPFAPTILHECQHKYIVNPKNITSPYMMLAFRTTEKARADLPAALHPYDFTARPQILKKGRNPGYYALLKRFESITGIGALLNTSFNLHGEPIVCSPEDAISTFERSGLEIVAIGNYLVSKKPIPSRYTQKKEKMCKRC